MAKKDQQDTFRQHLGADEKEDIDPRWDDAMKELEAWEKESSEEPAEKKEGEKPEGQKEEQQQQQQAPRPPARQDRPASRYEELCRTPSIQMEAGDLKAMTEFSEIISSVNEAARMVEKVREKHPDLVAQRFYDLWLSNLKDTSQVMMREFQTLRHGRQEKKYDKRYICNECHAVFLSPLPADGICDECRAGMANRQDNGTGENDSGEWRGKRG